VEFPRQDHQVGKGRNDTQIEIAKGARNQSRASPGLVSRHETVLAFKRQSSD
jgi:hypothetical protein